MAIIRGRTYNKTYHDFEIHPVLPTLDGPRDAYQIRLWKNGDLIFEAMYHISNIWWEGWTDMD
ncbi:MAG: hypothetical protein OHK0029_09140 [Armatimonadaceae bacterium]